MKNVFVLLLCAFITTASIYSMEKGKEKVEPSPKSKVSEWLSLANEEWKEQQKKWAEEEAAKNKPKKSAVSEWLDIAHKEWPAAKEKIEKEAREKEEQAKLEDFLKRQRKKQLEKIGQKFNWPKND